MSADDGWETVGRAVAFALRALGAVPLALFRPRELHRQLHQVLLGAFPLAVVVGLAMGVVVWMHLHGVLARFGPGYKQLLPQALALGVVLEFAPVAAGCIVASRSGAGLGAELGSMRLTEQIDALEVLGLSPLKELVAPRVLACMLALPLLTVFVDYLALAGSFSAEALAGGMSWLEYRNACLSRLRLEDVLPATLKTVVFGYLIGVTGCFFGVHARGGTEGVGRAATRGVVWSLFLVAVSNVLLVRVIQLVNGIG
jgi:phospholipid/cholesterol/gamma-HCH transport system permease protein